MLQPSTQLFPPPHTTVQPWSDSCEKHLEMSANLTFALSSSARSMESCCVMIRRCSSSECCSDSTLDCSAVALHRS